MSTLPYPSDINEIRNCEIEWYIEEHVNQYGIVWKDFLKYRIISCDKCEDCENNKKVELKKEEVKEPEEKQIDPTKSRK